MNHRDLPEVCDGNVQFINAFSGIVKYYPCLEWKTLHIEGWDGEKQLSDAGNTLQNIQDDNLGIVSDGTESKQAFIVYPAC